MTDVSSVAVVKSRIKNNIQVLKESLINGMWGLYKSFFSGRFFWIKVESEQVTFLVKIDWGICTNKVDDHSLS